MTFTKVSIRDILTHINIVDMNLPRTLAESEKKKEELTCACTGTILNG